MADVPLRFQWLRRTGEVVATIGAASGFIMLVIGVAMLWRQEDRPMWMTTGIALVVGGVLLDIVSMLVYGLLLLALKIEGTTNRLHTTMLDIDDRLRAISTPVQAIADNTHISDAAKSIAHRAKEREALRQAIREEIIHRDWEAAYYLIHQMERRFGYRQEAQKIRVEIDEYRQDEIGRKIVEAVQHIEQLCDQRHWDQARSESDRLVRLFPKDERAARATEVVDHKRDEYKALLLRTYHEAFGRNEADRCVEILKELDPFLTRSEAEALADSARGVFRTQLSNLGVQFSLAVTEKRWRAALELGLQIVGEFPNSRMAQEVREKLDALQKRAGLSPDKVADVIEQKAPGAPAS